MTRYVVTVYGNRVRRRDLQYSPTPRLDDLYAIIGDREHAEFTDRDDAERFAAVMRAAYPDSANETTVEEHPECHT